MQDDFERILRKERRRRRARVIFVSLLISSLLLAVMWTCSLEYGTRRKEVYTPFDMERQKLLQEEHKL